MDGLGEWCKGGDLARGAREEEDVGVVVERLGEEEGGCRRIGREGECCLVEEEIPL